MVDSFFPCLPGCRGLGWWAFLVGDFGRAIREKKVHPDSASRTDTASFFKGCPYPGKLSLRFTGTILYIYSSGASCSRKASILTAMCVKFLILVSSKWRKDCSGIRASIQRDIRTTQGVRDALPVIPSRKCPGLFCSFHDLVRILYIP